MLGLMREGKKGEGGKVKDRRKGKEKLPSNA